MLNIAICDDDYSFVEVIKDYIQKIKEILNIKINVNIFLSGIELLDFIKENKIFDIIFIDICMPHMNGAMLGMKIKSMVDTIIVYMSVSSDYFVDIFEVKPLGFFIKPIKFCEFERIFLVIYNHIFNSNIFFEFKIDREILRIKFKDIIYFKNCGRQVILYSIKGIYKFYEKFKNVYELSKNYKFLFIHKSYIINYDYISRITYDYVEMINGEILTISQRRKKDIRQQYVWISERSGSEF